MKRQVKSMLSPTAYPQASPKKWLVFLYPQHRRIDPVFAGRLAALAQSYNEKITVFSGYRSYYEQLCYYNALKGQGALRPGTSWHEYGGAVDISSQWVRLLDNVSLPYQTRLKCFGLCKPYSQGNGFYPIEDWHLQPIELADKNSLTFKRHFRRSYQ